MPANFDRFDPVQLLNELVDTKLDVKLLKELVVTTLEVKLLKELVVRTLEVKLLKELVDIKLDVKLLILDVVIKLDVCEFATYPNTDPEKDPVIPFVTFKLPVMEIPLPLTNKLPVITAEPLNGKATPVPPPAFSAYEAVKAYEELKARFAPVNVDPVIYDDVVAVPLNDPENDPVALRVVPSYVKTGIAPKTPFKLYCASPEFPAGVVAPPPPVLLI